MEPPPPPELFDPDAAFAFAVPDFKLPDALLPPVLPAVFAPPLDDALEPPVLFPVVAVLVVPRPEPVVDFDDPPAADLEEALPPPPVRDLLVDLPPVPVFAELPLVVFLPAVEVPVEDLDPDFEALPLLAELPLPPLLEDLLPELFAEVPEPLFDPPVLDTLPEPDLAAPPVPFAPDFEAPDREPPVVEREPPEPDLLPPLP